MTAGVALEHLAEGSGSTSVLWLDRPTLSSHDGPPGCNPRTRVSAGPPGWGKPEGVAQRAPPQVEV